MEADCEPQSAVVGWRMGIVGGSERHHEEIGMAGGVGCGGGVEELVMDGGVDNY